MVGTLNGRVLNADRNTSSGTNLFTVTQQDTFQARFRVQRDF